MVEGVDMKETEYPMALVIDKWLIKTEHGLFLQ
jgi:hypothetical protein